MKGAHQDRYRKRKCDGGWCSNHPKKKKKKTRRKLTVIKKKKKTIERTRKTAKENRLFWSTIASSHIKHYWVLVCYGNTHYYRMEPWYCNISGSPLMSRRKGTRSCVDGDPPFYPKLTERYGLQSFYPHFYKSKYFDTEVMLRLTLAVYSSS